MKLELGLLYCTFVLLCFPSCFSFVIQRAKSNYFPQSVQNLKSNTHVKNEELILNLTKTKLEPLHEYQLLNRIEELTSKIEIQRIKRQEAELPKTADYGKADDKTATDEADPLVVFDDTRTDDMKTDDTEADVDADVEVEDVEADDDEAEDVEADDVKVEDATVDDVTADDVKDDGVKDEDSEADDVKADAVTADGIKAGKVKADDVTLDVVTSDDVTLDVATSDDVTAGKVKADDVTLDVVTSDDVTLDVATSDDVTADDVTSDDVTADDVTTDEVTADEVTVDEVTVDEVTADEVTADEVTADEVTADEVTADEVTADEVTAKEVTADEVTAKEVTADDVKADDDDVKADDVKADDVKADDVKADDVKTDDVKADDVKADDVTADEKAEDTTSAEADTVEDIPSTVTDKVEDNPSTVTDKVENTSSTVTDKIEDIPSTVTDKVEDISSTVTDKVEDSPSTVTDKVENIPSTITDKVEGTPSAVTDKVELPVVADDVTVDKVKTDEKIKDTPIAETTKTDKVEHKHVEEAVKSSESDNSKTTDEKALQVKNIEKTETFLDSDGSEVSPKAIETPIKSHNSEKGPIPPPVQTPSTKINAESSAGKESSIKEIDMTKFVPSIEERVIYKPEQPKQEETLPIPAQIPAPPTISEVPVREQPKPFQQPNNRPSTHNPPLQQPKNKLKCPLPYVLFEPPQLPFRRQAPGQQNPLMHHVSRISFHFPNLRPIILYSENEEVTPAGVARNDYIVCILPSEDDIRDRSVLSEESNPSNPDFEPNFRRLFKPNGPQPRPPHSEGKLHPIEAPKEHPVFRTYRPREQHPGNSQFAQNDGKFHQRGIGPIFNIPGHPRVRPPHVTSNQYPRSRNNSGPSKHSQAMFGHNPRVPRPHLGSIHQPTRHHTKPEIAGNTQIMQIVSRNQTPKNVSATGTGYDVNDNDYKPAIFYYQQPKAAQPVNNTSTPSNKMYKNKARLYSAASKRG